MLPLWLQSLPGADALSTDFCNEPVEISTSWVDKPVAFVSLCGRLAGHDGGHDAIPPMSEVYGD